MEEPLKLVVGFLWDTGNRDKNLKSHGVRNEECEEVFFNQPLIAGPDIKHSLGEERYFLLGKTNAGRLLFLVYTIRSNHLRIISVRDMSKKERNFYAQQD